MRTSVLRLTIVGLLGLFVWVVAGIVSSPDTARATPAFQFSSQTLARSLFGEIDVRTHVDTHKVEIRTKGASDVYVVSNKVPVGGHSGWHSHPGPSIVSVKSGTATLYDGDDPNCTPVTYPAGTGFVDKGDGHVHILRNEGTVELETVAFSIVPAGADRRIDAPDPGYCTF